MSKTHQDPWLQQLRPKRAADAGDGPESPHRKTRAQSVVVDLAALKTLLADQSASLLEQNRAAMQEMMGDLKKEIRQGDEEIKATLAVQTTQITELQDHKVEVLRRLEALEARQGAAQTSHLVTDSASLDRHKSTLVFGGWPRETPKAVIISETHSAQAILAQGLLAQAVSESKRSRDPAPPCLRNGGTRLSPPRCRFRG